MDTEATPTLPDVSETIGRYGQIRPLWKRWIRWSVLALLLIPVAFFILNRNGGAATQYVTHEVTRGDITVTVTAIGNLEPRNQVDIGSELSGTIRTVAVDVNDTVKAGEVLAVLDTSRLEAQVLQAQSSLASTEARVLQSEAGLKEARANYARLQKVRELSGKRLPSQQDLDVAEVAVARTEGEQAAARAAVAQARANLDTVRTDLSKTDIRSPINGVVLVRSVEPGQTVAASLQAPVLFTLAEDLKKMELHVSVDEVDVGSVQIGQKATFTVDAFPNQVFAARITRIHLASNHHTRRAAQVGGVSTNNQSNSSSTGVVTYETVLEVDNSELLLRPGMTATAEIVTTRIENALVVPNAAMRFTPAGVPLPGEADSSERGSGMMLLMPYLSERWKCPRENGEALGCVWILEDGKPRLALFKPGPTDRSVTQVLDLGRLPNWSSLSRLKSDDIFVKAAGRRLAPGMRIIVDMNASVAR